LQAKRWLPINGERKGDVPMMNYVKKTESTKLTLTRTFLRTGEVRTPLVAVWSLMTAAEAAEEGELLRPAAWGRLFWRLTGWRACYVVVTSLL
jgi:hypothetical protein